MKKIYILLTVILGSISIQVSGQYFQQKTLSSKALQQDKTYYVGLPTGYNQADTITKYPVIIFLHGASVTATDMVNTLEPIVDNFFAQLIFDKLFKVIFIIPDGSCAPYKGSFYTNSTLYGNYEDYISKDLVAEIASKYHTSNHREKWSIMGHSMGGFGAMKIALQYPEKFIGVSSLSGPLNITYFQEILPLLLAEHGSTPPYDLTYSGSITQLVYSMAGAFSPNPGATPPVMLPVNSDGTIDQSVLSMWENYNPINLIKEWKGNPAMAIFTYCGDLDEFKLATPNQMFSDTLSKYNLPHTYIEDPNGDHVTSLITSLPQGINFLYNVMDTAQVRNTTIINPALSANTLNVYPNPATERFFVSGAVDKPKYIVIHNLSGQNVMQMENPILSQGIDIDKLVKGVYFVSLLGTNGTNSTLKLIKN